MINLDKLKNINEKLTTNTDIEELIQYYTEALNILKNITNKLKEIEDINKNLEETTELIHKISKKFNKQFNKTKLIHSTNEFKNFILIRQLVLKRSLNNIKNAQYQYSINKIIELYQDQFLLYYYKNNDIINLLKLDTNAPKTNIKQDETNLLSATSLTWYDDLEHKIFKNHFIKNDMEYISKILNYNSEYDDVLKEINTIYPTFLDDLQNTIKTFNNKINELRSDINEYIKILKKIKTLLNKYIDID